MHVCMHGSHTCMSTRTCTVVLTYITMLCLHYYSTVVRCDYQLVFNVNPNTLDKGERLEYGESMMIHAMVLTAVNEKQVGYQFVKRMQPYLY